MPNRPTSAIIVAAAIVSAGLISFCLYAPAFAGVGPVLTPGKTTSVEVDAPPPTGSEPGLALARQTIAALKTIGLPPKDAPPPTPFSQATIPWLGGDIASKWSRVVTEMHAEGDVLARCSENGRACPEAAQRLLSIVAIGRAQTGRVRIGMINREVNLAIKSVPMDDGKPWDPGVAGRWSAPLESLTSGRGDCKDYAIIKYVALIAAGVAPEDLNLVLVQDLAVRNEHNGHVVVTVHIDGHWLVLDNRWLALARDDELSRFVPEYLIDHNGVRAYVRSTAHVESAGH